MLLFVVCSLLTQLCLATLNGFVQIQLETALDLSFRRGKDWQNSLFLLNGFTKLL